MDPKPTYQQKYTNSRALVIGINEYEHASPLGYAVSDAKSIAEILETRFSFPKENIALLIDKEATGEAIRATYMQYAEDKSVDPDDRILVFFAGHGHTLPGKRGEVGFLVPSDGDPDDLSTLVRWDEFTRNADLIPAKHIFFMMDACYGGLALLRAPSFGSMRFLGDMLQRYTRQVLTAGKADEAVADAGGTRPEHSIFTSHLLDALDGAAATEEGIITANGVMAYVYDRVGRDQYSHQTPHYGFIDGDGDFIFDMSAVEKKRAESEKEPDSKDGSDADILINTSPEIVITQAEGPSVQDEMKELLSDNSKRIKLDDYVSSHVRRFLDETDLRHFPVQTMAVSNENFIERIERYEDAVKDLQQIVILLAKWGDKEQLQLLERIFIRIAEADKGSAGTVMWINLGWYPLTVLMYTAGITALATKKYEALAVVLQTPVQMENTTTRQPVIVPVVNKMNSLYESFKILPGHERHFVPRSEHLFKYLQPILEDALLMGKSYEAIFDDFEVMFALVYADATDRQWGPPGRFAWKADRNPGESPLARFTEESTKLGDKWGPIQAGLFHGTVERFKTNADMLKALIPKFNFW